MSSRFKVQPSIYCPENQFILLCSPKDSNLDKLREVLTEVLSKLDSGEYTRYDWDSVFGTRWDDKEQN